MAALTMASAGPDIALIADGLALRFGGVRALDGAGIAIRPGEAVGLLGPNGSGKTTLVNCLTGILRPNAGKIKMAGVDITALPPRRRAQLGIVRTFQNLRLMPDLSVAENVAVGLAGLSGALPAAEWRSRLEEALAMLKLQPFAGRPVGQMPYGVMKRVEIARALIARPKVLLLDEPAAGLGGADWQALANTLQVAQAEMGFGLLLIDHNMAFVRALARELVVLASGKILTKGSPEAVLQDREVARVYLGSLSDA